MNSQRKRHAEAHVRRSTKLASTVRNPIHGSPTWIRRHLFGMTLTAYCLQVVGTIELALFSFYGIEILKNDPDAYLEGIPKVTINPVWFRISKYALILLVVGLVLSAVVSLMGLTGRKADSEK
jgi:hypothetical protein